MTRRFICALLICAAAVPVWAADRKLLVLSVDGLDHRYLRDADELGLKIPNMRRLMREGAWAAGVIGVVPTVTWPSHTSMITGVPPLVHGILNNRRPKEQGGEYYWTTSLLKVPTLLDAARRASLKSAAITWPVTVDAPVDYNLPEYFKKRNGGGMDLHSIEEKGTPGLVQEISAMYPSFAQEWMDDRTRTQATLFLLRARKPDLILVHLVDLDAEAHHNGPFTREANAKVEYTDELIGDILRVLPSDYVLAVVSDHGFERIDRIVNVEKLLGQAARDSAITPFLLVAKTEEAARRIRELRDDPKTGIGAEVALPDLKRLTPQYKDAAAAWESAPHFSFGAGSDDMASAPSEPGKHGLWPLRKDYRSVFLMWGSGVSKRSLPEMQMVDIAPQLASILDLRYPFE